MIYAYILLCIFSCLQGIEEAILFSLKGAKAVKWNEHILFVCVRACPALLLFFVPLIIEEKIIVTMCYMLAYSFFHDECYYMSRHYIDLKSDNFFTETTTSNAKVNFNFPIRTGLFVVSLIVILLWQPYLHKLI